MSVTKRKNKKDIPKFEGVVDRLKSNDGFYVVFVEGSIYPPIVKHKEYSDARDECMRLATKESKTAYVMKAVTEIQLVPKVINFKND